MEGREDAFAALYDRYGRQLFRVALGLLDSSEEAEDIVQEVFVSIYRSRQSLAKVQNLKGYLFAALRHAAARRRGRMRAQQHAERGARQIADGPHPNTVSADRSARLERALQSLPREQREVIALKIDGGLTFAKIGAALGINPNTAASRYRYALERLRTGLKEE
jgi:RNA polymerase sigma-70 factor (ECF subfamily)